MGEGRLRFTDNQRRRLAEKVKRLGRRVLNEIDTLVTPDTPMAWHRKLIAMKWNHVDTYTQSRAPAGQLDRDGSFLPTPQPLPQPLEAMLWWHQGLLCRACPSPFRGRRSFRYRGRLDRRGPLCIAAPHLVSQPVLTGN